jgi:hypothetical protein
LPAPSLFQPETKFPRGAFGSPGLIEYSDDGVEERYNTSQCRIVGYANQQNLYDHDNNSERDWDLAKKPSRKESDRLRDCRTGSNSWRIAPRKVLQRLQATNPDSTVVALNSFEEPIILPRAVTTKDCRSIQSRLTPLKGQMAVLFGATSKKIAEALEGSCPS